MPINIKEGLPAVRHLERENIFVMTESRALRQDIRPLKIAILNLMPHKETTDLQLLRRLSNTPIQIEIELVRLETHEPKTTPKEYLRNFYTPFSGIRDRKFDGLIITGAPIEHLAFEEVRYWEELKGILDWSVRNVNSILYLCWASQAGLYRHFGIDKHPLPRKQFGIFPHTVRDERCPLVRGFDDLFWAPHSRHTTVRTRDVEAVDGLKVISESEEAGTYIIMSDDGKHIFVTGHSEYDPLTLKEEYERDRAKGLDIQVPVNYFPDDDPGREPVVTWRSHSNLLFTNWVNYYVYQATPYDISKIG